MSNVRHGEHLAKMFIMTNIENRKTPPQWHWLGERVGTLIRERRKARGLTQAKLAYYANVRRQVVIQIERGQGTCQIEYLWQILWALGMELDLRPKKPVNLEEARRLLDD